MADECYVCHKPFEDDEDPIDIMRGKYQVHEDCFVCAECKEPLEKMYMKEGRLLCKECACPKCKACGEAIEGKVIRFEDDRYHPKCFVCPECGQEIGSKDYKIVDGGYLCEECAAKKEAN